MQSHCLRSFECEVEWIAPVQIHIWFLYRFLSAKISKNGVWRIGGARHPSILGRLRWTWCRVSVSELHKSDGLNLKKNACFLLETVNRWHYHGNGWTTKSPTPTKSNHSTSYSWSKVGKSSILSGQRFWSKSNRCAWSTHIIRPYSSCPTPATICALSMTVSWTKQHKSPTYWHRGWNKRGTFIRLNSSRPICTTQTSNSTRSASFAPCRARPTTLGWTSLHRWKTAILCMAFRLEVCLHAIWLIDFSLFAIGFPVIASFLENSQCPHGATSTSDRSRAMPSTWTAPKSIRSLARRCSNCLPIWAWNATHRMCSKSSTLSFCMFE